MEIEQCTLYGDLVIEEIRGQIKNMLESNEDKNTIYCLFWI
jgi:hypothetical protein